MRFSSRWEKTPTAIPDAIAILKLSQLLHHLYLSYPDDYQWPYTVHLFSAIIQRLLIDCHHSCHHSNNIVTTAYSLIVVFPITPTTFSIHNTLANSCPLSVAFIPSQKPSPIPSGKPSTSPSKKPSVQPRKWSSNKPSQQNSSPLSSNSIS
jgi:hypothetical protein